MFENHRVICSTLLAVLICFFSQFSFAQTECKNLATSNGAPPQVLADLCSNPNLTQDLINKNSTGDIAFGWEFVESDVDIFELSTPEVLTPQGKVGEPEERFITGCDFDNTGTFNELYCISDEGDLISSDIVTKITTKIGAAVPYNQERFTGLATDPSTGTMYASSNDLSSSSLYTVDLESGVAIRVGEVTNSPGLIAIAVNNQGQMFGFDIVYDILLKINKETGAGKIVGPLGFNANYAQGMDFNEADNKCYLFAFNSVSFQAELRTCNTNTGLTKFIGVLGATTPGGTRQITGAGIASVAPVISIVSVTPGISNSINKIIAEGATPDRNVAFVWGSAPGSIKIGGKTCNGLEIALSRPKLLGIVRSFPDQVAELAFFIPFFTEAQAEFFFQAVDVRSCVTSEIVPEIIVSQ